MAWNRRPKASSTRSHKETRERREEKPTITVPPDFFYFSLFPPRRVREKIIMMRKGEENARSLNEGIITVVNRDSESQTKSEAVRLIWRSLCRFRRIKRSCWTWDYDNLFVQHHPEVFVSLFLYLFSSLCLGMICGRLSSLLPHFCWIIINNYLIKIRWLNSPSSNFHQFP